MTSKPTTMLGRVRRAIEWVDPSALPRLTKWLEAQIKKAEHAQARTYGGKNR